MSTPDDAGLVAALRRNRRMVEDRIAEACAAVGRDPGEVRLLAVSKTHPLEVVRAAWAAGNAELAENRVAEALDKRRGFEADPPADGRLPRWHLIGHLQGNKARAAVEFADEFHALDSAALAHRLERLLTDGSDRVLDVFVQVNTSGEATKSGVEPGAAAGLAELVAGLPHLRLRGLMTIAAHRPDDPSAVRREFVALRTLADDLHHRDLAAGNELSMGMSDDFDQAIAEGATTIRVGRALFGNRQNSASTPSPTGRASR